MINWGHVLYSKYVPWLFVIGLLSVTGLFLQSVLQLQLSLPGVFKDTFEAYIIPYDKVSTVESHMWSIYYALGWKWTLLCLLATAYMWQAKAPVYLLDHSTFQPPKGWQVNHQDILRIMRNINPNFTEVLRFPLNEHPAPPFLDPRV